MIHDRRCPAKRRGPARVLLSAEVTAPSSCNLFSDLPIPGARRATRLAQRGGEQEAGGHFSSHRLEGLSKGSVMDWREYQIKEFELRIKLIEVMGKWNIDMATAEKVRAEAENLAIKNVILKRI